MPYIIDGHNLIPKIHGLNLHSMDDELQLVDKLQEFCRREKKQIEVYFDGALPGGARSQRFGPVTARFVRAGNTADNAIRARLTRLGKGARNYTVVSSDLAVQASAREFRAQFVSSEDFARLLDRSSLDNLPEPGKQPDISLSDEEIDQWLEMFGDAPEGS